MTERLWPAGTLRVPRGTCPGCAGDSHPGFTCDGLTSEQSIEILRSHPRAVSVPLDDRERRARPSR